MRLVSACKITCCPPGCRPLLRHGPGLQKLTNYPAHKKYLVVSWHDGIYVQHNAIEGLCSASGIQGTLADTCIEILCANGIHPVFKWVDDFIIFCSPSLPPCQMMYLTMTMICHLSSTSQSAWHSLACGRQERPRLCLEVQLPRLCLGFDSLVCISSR